jgi:hypothetical protein
MRASRTRQNEITGSGPAAGMTGLVLGLDGRNTTRGRGPLRGHCCLRLATIAEQPNIVAFAAHSPLGGSKFVSHGRSSMRIVLQPAAGIADGGTHASAVCDEISTRSEERPHALQQGNIHARGRRMGLRALAPPGAQSHRHGAQILETFVNKVLELEMAGMADQALPGLRHETGV